ncbi:hypothetical protein RJ639_046345 [Escallonia herrerae]|uniref:Uncharacterized protein n=1 Tax=Escallonia herrerae TaxID=1293975 RepID=A0AA89B0E4_9ASTE|nr:hypothetical protein RJ639_046345 [Escallonia herrerae]
MSVNHRLAIQSIIVYNSLLDAVMVIYDQAYDEKYKYFFWLSSISSCNYKHAGLDQSKLAAHEFWILGQGLQNRFFGYAVCRCTLMNLGMDIEQLIFIGRKLFTDSVTFWSVKHAKHDHFNCSVFIPSFILLMNSSHFLFNSSALKNPISPSSSSSKF